MIIEAQDIFDIEQEALTDGRLNILPHAFWTQFTPDQIRFFCWKNGCYSIPTVELVNWLAERIVGKKTIEIGAGNGVLAEALGIGAVDNYQQMMPKYTLFYLNTNQPIIRYGGNVIEADANEAVEKEKPEVVIGSWITERYDPAYHKYGGNEIGPKQLEIINQVDTYYLIGNLDLHGNPKLMNLKHKTYRIPLISRAFDPHKNVIFEFSK